MSRHEYRAAQQVAMIFFQKKNRKINLPINLRLPTNTTTISIPNDISTRGAYEEEPMCDMKKEIRCKNLDKSPEITNTTHTVHIQTYAWNYSLCYFSEAVFEPCIYEVNE